MGSASTNGNNNYSVKKSIGKTLLMCLLPVIIIGVVAIILILSFNAKATIEDVSLMDLQAETQTNAYNIGTGFRMLLAKFGQYCDTMEQVPFEDEEAILKYIEPSTNYTIINNTGIYIPYRLLTGSLHKEIGINLHKDMRHLLKLNLMLMQLPVSFVSLL